MLGVCYYPEHWPEEWWKDDAHHMAEMGISHVRVGEFSWSAIEPTPGTFDWGWLDRAVDTLGAAGLKIVMGTPTATPPKWLVDHFPAILAHDHHGRTRGFGSRRHYCFSSPEYRRQSQRITEAFANRYGQNPHVVGWQTDNEYGCHDTVRSYSPAAAEAFRGWLANRYGSIQKLNEAWGNRFWSMEYRTFDEVPLPMGAVTELNPSHRLDFFRFSSDQVASFNREQVRLIRKRAPGRWITHNYMGAFLDFDHFKVGEDLDLASWDSYPLGFTDSIPWLGLEEADRQTYAQTGHPDLSAFHHDLYRAVGKGRWWIMEQQPGPVNWALWNPSPAAGMVRLWTWEAFAHGAECVSYFRWRQAPFAQEQMHAGLNRPDRVRDAGGHEAAQVGKELATPGGAEAYRQPAEQAPVALIFDYDGHWAQRIQPQGMSWEPLALTFGWYRALRALGLTIDLVAPGASLKGYKLVVAPVMTHASPDAVAALAAAEGVILLGPRTASKTESFQIPRNLPPGPLPDLIPIKVTRVESLRPGTSRKIAWDNMSFDAIHWAEWVEMGEGVEPLARFADGKPALMRKDRVHYLAAWPDKPLLAKTMAEMARAAGLQTREMTGHLRMRTKGKLTFAINYGPDPVPSGAPDNARFLLGGPAVGPHDVSVWAVA
jgi:beta-galactosidase